MLAALAAALLALNAPATDSDPEDWEEEPAEPAVRRFELTAWGGSALLLDNGGRSTPFAGAEVGTGFGSGTLSVLFEEHRFGEPLATRDWTPVALLRFGQHFTTERGIEGSLTFGLGAGRPQQSWIPWYQLAAGIRLGTGPLTARGELGIERDNLLRLAVGVGLSF